MRSPFFAALVLSILLVKLLLAVPYLFTPGEAPTTFAVPEALAKEQKKPALQKTKKSSQDTPTPSPEPAPSDSGNATAPASPVDV
ncbi:MAG TPA: hypothetical protein DCE18_08230, partial [Syntrophobacteraceae bacterium]|nr:hypothetical protein [Syntrophobacteraceae bacterium]